MAAATNLGNGSWTSNTASAQGGAGGAGGSGSPQGAGGAGGAGYASVSFSLNTTAGTYGGALATGGAGGNGGVGGAGGGAAASASVESEGAISAVAGAYGGAGGEAGQGDGGPGGSATASASAISTTSGAADVTATSTAKGGFGGVNASAGGNGGAGGASLGAQSSSTEASATGGQATASSHGYGGYGGAGYGAGFVGGAGGSASGSRATATGNSARAIVIQSGGHGGYGHGGAGGGAGGSSILNNAVQATANGGSAYLRQVAGGGGGGFSDNGVGGAGGSASSVLTVTDTLASSVVAVAGAYGGIGGVAVNYPPGLNGAGGGATALVTLTAAHAASAFAIGFGGGGYISPPHGGYYSGYYAGPPPLKARWGAGGGAGANASAVSTGSGAGDTAYAFADAAGGGGSVQGASSAVATASTASGQQAEAFADAAYALATAQTISAGTVTQIITKAEQQNTNSIGPVVAVAGGQQLISQSGDDFVDATATPGSGLTAALNAAPAVEAALTTALAGGEQAGNSNYTGYILPGSYRSTASFTLNTTGLRGDLVLGLLDDQVIGAGFSALALKVEVGGVVKVEQDFTSLAAAEAYFTNNVIDLGAVAVSTNLKVSVSLDVAVDSTAEGFTTNYVLGLGPAPGAGSLLNPSGGGSIVVPNGVSQVDLSPAAAGGSQTPYDITANANPNLAIEDHSGDPDLITLGAVGQSVLTYGAGTVDHVIAGAIEAGDLIQNQNHAADILEITDGGAFALNPADFNVTAELDQPSTLTLNGTFVGVEGATGGDTIIVTASVLNETTGIQLGGTGNTLELLGGGYFHLALPKVLAGIEVVSAQEGQAAYSNGNLAIAGTEQTVFLRDGLNVTVNVASDVGSNPDNPNPAGIVIHGGNDADLINLGAGTDTVFLGSNAETIVGGGGPDTFYASAATAGAAIDGGTGASVLDLTGGGAVTLGQNVTSIGTLNLTAAAPSQLQAAWNVVAPAIEGLRISDFSNQADTITFGAGSQTAEDVGTGADLFRFTSPGLGIDTIIGFKSGLDHIGLASTGFGVSSLATVAFDIAPSPGAPANGEPNILYDTKTGSLYFDALGGDGHIIQFATLSGHPALAASDFVLG